MVLISEIDVVIEEQRHPTVDAVIRLYKACGWSAAEKPGQLYKALLNSHTFVTAWVGDELVGLGNVISDGYLVAYFSHLLVLPEYRKRNIGSMIMDKMLLKYKDFHQKVLLSDESTCEFYVKKGFERSGNTVPMWIFSGKEHG